LWKPAADEDPGWDSPWGRGRPGWHLECSAMIREHLGETIDIHGGGRDLIFPHHENEIAQSRCAHGGDYVKYWMHNAYLDIDGEKMSKSIGNVRSVRDLLKVYRGEVLRFALLSAHYRSPLNFSAELLEQAETTLGGLYSTLRDVQDIELDVDVPLAGEAFYQALEDDLNTPVAIAEIHALAKQLHKASAGEKPVLKARILAAGNLLGILEQDPQAWLQGGVSDDVISAQDIEAQILARQDAKLSKDYARADEIRQALLDQGVVLEDSREGTQWRRTSD
jgi:cysteinyl-tRNA synthetase